MDPSLICWSPSNIFSFSLSVSLLYLVTFVLSCPFLSPWGTVSVPCDLPPSLHPPSWYAGRVQRQAQGPQQEHQSPPSSSEPATVLLLLRFVHSTSHLPCPPSFPIHPSPSIPVLPPSFSSFLPFPFFSPLSFPLIPSSSSSLLPPLSLHAECSVCCMDVGWREAWETLPMQARSPFSAGRCSGPPLTSSGDGGAPGPGYRLPCPCLVLHLIQAWHCSLVEFHCWAKSGPSLQPL